MDRRITPGPYDSPSLVNATLISGSAMNRKNANWVRSLFRIM